MGLHLLIASFYYANFYTILKNNMDNKAKQLLWWYTEQGVNEHLLQSNKKYNENIKYLEKKLTT